MNDKPGFDPRRVVLVSARSANSDGEAAVEQEVATGYFLTGNLVLTARHVADNPNATFEVRAEVDSANGPFSDAALVWMGLGDVDALLLRTSKTFGNWELPPFAENVGSGSWTSAGFAKLTLDEETGRRKTLPLTGTFGLSRGQGAPELFLSTDQIISAGRNQYWKGLSGSPVFSITSGELLGIVTDASAILTNNLSGLPSTRLIDDIQFRSTVGGSFLGPLPDTAWCLVLTSEGGSEDDLVGRVAGVLSGFRDKELRFQDLHEAPVQIRVLDAISSVENWIVAIEALARADYLIADVTGFEPAVMLLLGIRSVLRRGVTISVTGANLDEHASELPFNVQETKVLYHEDEEFHDDLRQVMADGAATLAMDPNYLDLPAFHSVRSPRPETWAEEDRNRILVLCPFNAEYSAFYRKELKPIIRAYTRDGAPLRMLDLRSPRLVGQALYEQIRWASRCIVDWTEWRPNVFFELGVRLGCSENDPICLIDPQPYGDHAENHDSTTSELRQNALLRQLLRPVEYSRASRSEVREVLRAALESSWREVISSRPTISHAALPVGATFAITQKCFHWESDSMLNQPHAEQRQSAERITGKDKERLPEKLVLFSNNERFGAALSAAVREKWISAWLYLRHLCSEDENYDSEEWVELIEVSAFTLNALSSSRASRHTILRKEIREFLRAHRSRKRASGAGGNNDE